MLYIILYWRSLSYVYTVALYVVYNIILEISLLCTVALYVVYNIILEISLLCTVAVYVVYNIILEISLFHKGGKHGQSTPEKSARRRCVSMAVFYYSMCG